MIQNEYYGVSFITKFYSNERLLAKIILQYLYCQKYNCLNIKYKIGLLIFEQLHVHIFCFGQLKMKKKIIQALTLNWKIICS